MSPGTAPNKIDLIDLANRTHPLLDGTLARVVEIMSGSDLFFCVWLTADESDGVGIKMVKGADLLERISRDDEKALVAVGCVWAASSAHAEALQLLDRTACPT